MASGLKVDSMARLLVKTILEEDAKHPSDVDIQESVARSLQDKIKKVKMNGDVKPSVPTHEDPSELPVEELPELSFPIRGNSSLWDRTTSFNNFSGKDGLIYEQVPIGRGTMVEVSLPCDTCQEVVRVNIPRLQDGDQRMFLGNSPIECKPCSKQRYKHSFKSAKGREERRESAIEWLERRAAVHNKWICHRCQSQNSDEITECQTPCKDGRKLICGHGSREFCQKCSGPRGPAGDGQSSSSSSNDAAE